MSPPPCRLRQMVLLPGPGMWKRTAPGVTDPGQATSLPVAWSTQWPSLARSPCGGVPGAGVALARVAPSGMPSWAGGGAPLLSRAAVELGAQPAGKDVALVVIPEVPVFANPATGPNGPLRDPT